MPIMWATKDTASAQPRFASAARENGRWKGQQDGPNRVVSARVHNYFTFNQKGTYSYQVKQGTSQYDLEGVRAFHVRIEEAQLDYDLD